MREIRFRAQKAGGEWTTGSLITDKYERSDGQQFDVAFIATGLPCMEQPGDMWTARMYRVKPDTIGQFTGLCDRNGKEIYEGDIIRCTLLDKKEKIGVVVSENGCFWFVCNNGYSDEYLVNMCDKDVIGNIHDNPELINKEKED